MPVEPESLDPFEPVEPVVGSVEPPVSLVPGPVPLVLGPVVAWVVDAEPLSPAEVWAVPPSALLVALMSAVVAPVLPAVSPAVEPPELAWSGLEHAASITAAEKHVVRRVRLHIRPLRWRARRQTARKKRNDVAKGGSHSSENRLAP
jgi:hypothetical protein